MSKGHTTSNAVANGGSRQTQMHMHHMSQDAKREMWADMVKRKEAAKKPKSRTLDHWYIDRSNMQAKAISAMYLIVKNKKLNWKTFDKQYGFAINTVYSYRSWYRNNTSVKPSNINQFIFDNLDDLVADIKKAPNPTIKEIDRLIGLSRPKGWDLTKGGMHSDYINKPDRVVKDKIAVDQAEATGEIPVINFDVDEKHLSKSDVVVGVITGALIGGAMVAYLFMSNGAI